MLALIPLNPCFPNGTVDDHRPILSYEAVKEDTEDREYRLLVTYGKNKAVLGYDKIVTYKGGVYALADIPEYWTWKAAGYDYQDLYNKYPSLFNRRDEYEIDLEMYETHTLTDELALIGLEPNTFQWGEYMHTTGPLIEPQGILQRPFPQKPTCSVPRIAKHLTAESSVIYPNTLDAIQLCMEQNGSTFMNLAIAFNINQIADPASFKSRWNNEKTFTYQWWATTVSATGFPLMHPMHAKFCQLAQPSTRRILATLYELLTQCTFTTERSAYGGLTITVQSDWLETVGGNSLEGMLRYEIREEARALGLVEPNTEIDSIQLYELAKDPRLERLIWKHLRHLRTCVVLYEWLKDCWKQYIVAMGHDMFWFAADCAVYEQSENHIRAVMSELTAVFDANGKIVLGDALPHFYYIHTVEE